MTNLVFFWILFGLLLFTLLVILIFFVASSFQKKRIEQKLNDVFLEVRELNLRVTVVETRVEERMPQMYPVLPQISESSAPKRGRPKKKIEE